MYLVSYYFGVRFGTIRVIHRTISMKFINKRGHCSIFLCLFLCFQAVISARQNIVWWHAMGGSLNEKVNAIAREFNQSQADYRIHPVYKGNYTETMTAAVAAFRARKHPHIVQVFEVGTATMMAAKKAVYPVYKLMSDTGESFKAEDFLAAVTGYYTDPAGNMYSMPFNSSTPVLYYNREALKKAGFDKPPATWDELEKISRAGLKKDYSCGVTVGWQSWTQLENYGAVHDVPFATLSNGFEGLEAELQLNNPAFVKHIGNLANWQKDKIFVFGGRRSDSAPKFYNGQCIFYINSSASYSSVKANVSKFNFGVSFLPYWKDLVEKPKNSIIGGASLWVLREHPESDYKGVAKFFSFLASQRIQSRWHRETGYLPVTHEAYRFTKSQGFYEQNPGTETAILQMTRGIPTANSKGLRLGNFVQIRDVINEELESIWAGTKTVEEGLADATQRGNKLIRKFLRRNF